MGTVGCIAIGNMENWTGVCNLSDSKPSLIGMDVWNCIHKKYALDLQKFAADLHQANSWDELKDGTLNSLRCKDDEVTSKNPNPLFVEWIYIIDPKERTFIIFCATDHKSFVADKINDKPVLDDDGYWNYGHCRYRHNLIIMLNLDGKEPDWIALDKMRE